MGQSQCNQGKEGEADKMPADGEVAAAGGCRARKVLLVSVAIGVLVAGGVTAGLVFGLGGSKPPSGNPLENPGTENTSRKGEKKYITSCGLQTLSDSPETQTQNLGTRGLCKNCG